MPLKTFGTILSMLGEGSVTENSAALRVVPENVTGTVWAAGESSESVDGRRLRGSTTLDPRAIDSPGYECVDAACFSDCYLDICSVAECTTFECLTACDINVCQPMCHLSSCGARADAEGIAAPGYECVGMYCHNDCYVNVCNAECTNFECVSSCDENYCKPLCQISGCGEVSTTRNVEYGTSIFEATCAFDSIGAWSNYEDGINQVRQLLNSMRRQLGALRSSQRREILDSISRAEREYNQLHGAFGTLRYRVQTIASDVEDVISDFHRGLVSLDLYRTRALELSSMMQAKAAEITDLNNRYEVFRNYVGDIITSFETWGHRGAAYDYSLSIRSNTATDAKIVEVRFALDDLLPRWNEWANQL